MIHDFKAVTLSQMCHEITDKTKIGIFLIRFKLCVIPEIWSNNRSITINKYWASDANTQKGDIKQNNPILTLDIHHFPSALYSLCCMYNIYSITHALKYYFLLCRTVMPTTVPNLFHFHWNCVNHTLFIMLNKYATE